MVPAKVQTDLAKARWFRSDSEIFFDEAGYKLYAVAYSYSARGYMSSVHYCDSILYLPMD